MRPRVESLDGFFQQTGDYPSHAYPTYPQSAPGYYGAGFFAQSGPVQPQPYPVYHDAVYPEAAHYQQPRPHVIYVPFPVAVPQPGVPYFDERDLDHALSNNAGFWAETQGDPYRLKILAQTFPESKRDLFGYLSQFDNVYLKRFLDHDVNKIHHLTEAFPEYMNYIFNVLTEYEITNYALFDYIHRDVNKLETFARAFSVECNANLYFRIEHENGLNRFINDDIANLEKLIKIFPTQKERIYQNISDPRNSRLKAIIDSNPHNYARLVTLYPEHAHDFEFNSARRPSLSSL